MNTIDLLGPQVAVLVAAALMLVVESLVPQQRRWLPLIAIAGLAISAIWTISWLARNELPKEMFDGTFVFDDFSAFFYLLFAHFRLSVSLVILVAMSVGSLMNPVGFLVLAIKPDTKQIPASPFGAIMATSFTLTTIGYAGAAWSVARAAVLTH